MNEYKIIFTGEYTAYGEEINGVIDRFRSKLGILLMEDKIDVTAIKIDRIDVFNNETKS